MTKGEKIKKLRISEGLSQIELANMLNTTKQNIYKYESGIVTNIPSDKIEQIANIFKVSPCYIMGWDENAFTNSNPNSTKNQVILSSHEVNVINAYRSKPDMQPVVDKILDVKEEKKYIRFVAARSENGQSPIRTEEVSKELYEDLLNAPETDLDL